MKYKNIVFDFGNVLGWFNETYILEQFFDKSEDFTLLRNLILEDWNGIDAGTTDYAAYASYVVSRAEERLRPGLEKFFKEWYRHLTPIQQTWDFVRELKKKGANVYILSNAPTYFAEHAHFYKITKEFDGVVFSAVIRMAKPDAAIYHYLFDTYHLEPEECFFLDDREKNIKAAQKLGMNGIVFTGDIKSVKKAIAF